MKSPELRANKKENVPTSPQTEEQTFKRAALRQLEATTTSVFPKFPGWLAREKRKLELRPQIREKEKNAMSKNEFRKNEEEYIDLMSREIQGPLSGEDAERLKQVKDARESATMKFDNLFDYRVALEILRGPSKEYVNHVLNHENAHANIGSRLGLNHKGYSIIFTATTSPFTGKREIEYTPSANFGDFPTEWSQEKIKEVAAETAYAPELYGDRMSESDEKTYEAATKDKDR